MLQELGIADFDVTGDFDISDIDKALEKVNAGRSKVGAQTNVLEYAYNYNTNARMNTIGAKSRLEDLDYPKPMHRQKAFEDMKCQLVDLSVSEDLCTRVLELPIHPYLQDNEQEQIVEAIKEYFLK